MLIDVYDMDMDDIRQIQPFEERYEPIQRSYTLEDTATTITDEPKPQVEQLVTVSVAQRFRNMFVFPILLRLLSICLFVSFSIVFLASETKYTETVYKCPVGVPPPCSEKSVKRYSTNVNKAVIIMALLEFILFLISFLPVWNYRSVIAKVICRSFLKVITALLIIIPVGIMAFTFEPVTCTDGMGDRQIIMKGIFAATVCLSFLQMVLVGDFSLMGVTGNFLYVSSAFGLYVSNEFYKNIGTSTYRVSQANTLSLCITSLDSEGNKEKDAGPVERGLLATHGLVILHAVTLVIFEIIPYLVFLVGAIVLALNPYKNISCNK